MGTLIDLTDFRGGEATITFKNHSWQRVPVNCSSSGKPRWIEGHKRVRHRMLARLLERIYQHPEEIKRIRRYPRVKPALKPGLPVYSQTLGFGEISAVDGDVLTAIFNGRNKQVGAKDLVTRAEAEIDWHDYWLSGAKRRLSEGKRLWVVKGLCQRGEWMAFLKRYKYPRNTADDLIRRYKTEVLGESSDGQMPGNRAFQIDEREAGPSVDPETTELEKLLSKENKKRLGRRPTYHPTLWSLRIKLPQDVLKRCRKKYQEDGDEAKEYWRRAAYRFVNLDPDRPEGETRSKIHEINMKKSPERDRSATQITQGR